MKEEKSKIDLFSQKSKTLWKFFFLVLAANIIIFNWSEISWIFNYRVAPKGLQSVIINKDPAPEDYSYYGMEDNIIKIAAIDISAPLIIPESSNDADIYYALKKGIAHFPGSALPGERGVSIFLGHSSPPGWPRIDYDWVFTQANDLEKGDKIEIYFNNQLFVYTVTEKVFLEIGQDVPSYDSNEKEIILLSCWPPGKNIKRIGIRGVLTN